MSEIEAVPEAVQLTGFQRAVIEVLQASRDAADARLDNRTQYENQVLDSIDEQASYKVLAAQEARKLGRLLVKKGRLLSRFNSDPEFRVQRRAIWENEDESWVGARKPLTRAVTSPLLFTHDPLYVTEHLPEDDSSHDANMAPQSLVSGWRFTARVTGSHVLGGLSCFKPEPKDRFKVVTALRVDQVVRDNESGQERVADTDMYGIEDKYRLFTMREGLDDNDPHFMQQLGLIIAAQKVMREQSHMAGV